jgi:hypothetical protein
MSVWLAGGNDADGSLRMMAGTATPTLYYANFDECPISGRPRRWHDRPQRADVTRDRSELQVPESSYGYVKLGLKGGVRSFLGHDKRRVFLYAQLRPSNSRLTYDSNFCKRISLPTR